MVWDLQDNKNMKEFEKAVDFIKSKTDLVPEIALILGSGLGPLADEIQKGVKIPYADIPGFSPSKVEGHAGCLVIGTLNNRKVVAMQGRFHFYEGYSMKAITLPVRVMKLLGANILLVTNAAGGVNTNFTPGDLMIICDHINGMGTNPLIGENISTLGPRFPDMTYAYNKDYIYLVEKIAEDLKIKIQKGVYYSGTGPCYETPAEIKMAQILGADAMGMSTVPEVIVANHMGMNVLGISCITNMAAGILPQLLNHEEVIKTANKVKSSFIKLMKEIIKQIN